jgi:tRNA G18 (ribose-2'-O)-methylase SpoU
MPKIIEINDFSAPELDVFSRLTGAQLRNKLEPDKGIFIAESPTVIEVALNSGCEPLSMLTEDRLINGAVSRIIERVGDIPIYTAKRELLAKLTGFELTRGALCAMRRPKSLSVEALLSGARRIAVFEAIADSTNIGALFRSAAAFDVDGVLITPTCCDPLCRRALRVSMGTVLQIPYAKIGEAEGWPLGGMEVLKKHGFKVAAMALTDDSVSIDDERLPSEEKLAIVLGTEGTGLLAETIRTADYTVKIPMSHGVDSLNVAAAGAVAFYRLCKK